MVVSQEDRTALMWAAMKGHTDVFKALIENGADVNAKEKVRSRYNTVVGANDQRMFWS
jgi:ankyrin repeat protein